MAMNRRSFLQRLGILGAGVAVAPAAVVAVAQRAAERAPRVVQSGYEASRIAAQQGFTNTTIKALDGFHITPSTIGIQTFVTERVTGRLSASGIQRAGRLVDDAARGVFSKDALVLVQQRAVLHPNQVYDLAREMVAR